LACGRRRDQSVAAAINVAAGAGKARREAGAARATTWLKAPGIGQ